MKQKIPIEISIITICAFVTALISIFLPSVMKAFLIQLVGVIAFGWLYFLPLGLAGGLALIIYCVWTFRLRRTPNR